MARDLQSSGDLLDAGSPNQVAKPFPEQSEKPCPELPCELWFIILKYLDRPQRRKFLQIDCRLRSFVAGTTSLHTSLFRSERLIIHGTPIQASMFELHPAFIAAARRNADCEYKVRYSGHLLVRHTELEFIRRMATSPCNEFATSPAIQRFGIRLYDGKTRMIRNKRGVTALQVFKRIARYRNWQTFYDDSRRGQFVGWKESPLIVNGAGDLVWVFSTDLIRCRILS